MNIYIYNLYFYIAGKFRPEVFSGNKGTLLIFSLGNECFNINGTYSETFIRYSDDLWFIINNTIKVCKPFVHCLFTEYCHLT